jgi:hypothetical protein
MPTILMATDWGLSDTWAASQDYFEMSAAGAPPAATRWEGARGLGSCTRCTSGGGPCCPAASRAGDSTNQDVLALRSDILFEMIIKGACGRWRRRMPLYTSRTLPPPPVPWPHTRAGYTPAHTETVWGEAHGKTNVAVVVDTPAAAAALAPFYRYLRAQYPHAVRVCLVIAIDPVASPSHTRAQVLAELGVNWQQEERRLGVWDLMLHKIATHFWSPGHVLSEATVALSGVFQTVRPAIVVAPFSRTTTMSLAVGATAAALHIPVVGAALGGGGRGGGGWKMRHAAPLLLRPLLSIGLFACRLQQASRVRGADSAHRAVAGGCGRAVVGPAARSRAHSDTVRATDATRAGARQLRRRHQLARAAAGPGERGGGGGGGGDCVGACASVCDPCAPSYRRPHAD